MSVRCRKDHQFEAIDSQAGIRRMACRNCAEVQVDLNVGDEVATVSTAGLFKPTKPTLFSVLGQDLRERENAAVTEPEPDGNSGRHMVFGGAF